MIKKILNAPNVLRLIRDNVATDLKALCLEFGLAPDKFESIYVSRLLEDLQRAELIIGTDEGHFMISSKWELLHRVFRIGLTELGAFDQESSMIIEKPFFGKPNALSKTLDLFVLMPFSEELRPVFDDHIKKVAETLQLKAKRADNFFAANHIMWDIWDAINAARAIIADCTGRNPNVFYEIGLAHAVGKSVILITQKGNDVPFDLKSLRYIQYEYNPRGMRAFENVLSKTLKETLRLSN